MINKSKILRFLPLQSRATKELDWEVVYDEYLPKLYNFFFYQVNSKEIAEDLTASTFEQAWKNRHRYKNELGAFSTWLFTIARRKAIDYFRQQRPNIPLESVTALIAEQTIEQEIELSMDIDRLLTLIQALPPDTQTIIALKYGSQLSHREISNIMNLSETNVGTILHRTIKELRHHWDKENNHG